MEDVSVAHDAWGQHDDDDDHDDDFIALQVCFQAQLVLAEDHRSYSCDMVEGPQCLSIHRRLDEI